MPPENIEAFREVYHHLRVLLQEHARRLAVQANTPESYILNTRQVDAQQRPIAFASVHIKKSYVSFYLMPVYCFPDLLQGLSRELKKHMHGKSCFNFTRRDDFLFEELKIFTQHCLDRYEAEGML